MKMFLQPDSDIAEGIFKKWNTLFLKCLNRGISIVTLDEVEDYNNLDYIVFSDFPIRSNPAVEKAFTSNVPKILIIEEGPLIHPDNWDLNNHRFFKYIFTWNDDFVDNIKYFKFNVHFIDLDILKHPKSKLCTLIARNKRACGKSELYSVRRSIIRFFEKYHPSEFDLYGEGWDMYYFPSNVPILKLFNGSKLYFFRSLIKEKFPSWKGPISNKKEILAGYKFSISFENSFGPNGYISEKIWDSFAAGTVPIYLGAPNVLQHIPSGCFIDFSKFNSINELYNYIKNMPNKDYDEYIRNINNFLKEQSNGGVFSEVYFADSIINILLK